jgi:hypothetical protein
LGPFSPDHEDFADYLDRLECYLDVNEVEQSLHVKMVISLFGPEMYRLLKRLCVPVKPTAKSYREVIDMLSKHFAPEKSEITERFKFFKRDQKEGESPTDYICELKHLANSCNFGEFLQSALRDRFVCGLRRESFQKQLLEISDLTFERACTMATSHELTEDKVHILQGSHIQKVFQPSRSKSKSSQPSRQKREEKKKIVAQCKHCGRRHEEDSCPAKTWKCFHCNKTGHTSRVCRDAKPAESPSPSYSRRDSNRGHSVKQVDVGKSTVVDEEHEGFDISSVKAVSQSSVMPVIVKLIVENSNLTMEVDSRAVCSIIPDELYQQHFNHVRLCKSKLQLSTPLGERFQVVGEIQVSVTQVDKRHQLPLVVVHATRLTPLLGRPWLDVLVPDWRSRLSVGQVHCVGRYESDRLASEIRSDFPTVFAKVGPPIRGYVAEIVVNPEVSPIFHKEYSVPYAISEAVQAELSRLVESGTLERVKESKWASPLVVARKKDGSVRLCADFKVTLNKVVDTEYYALPLLDDIFASLAGGQVFSVLDLKDAYLQLPVAEASKQYLTINTGQGLLTFAGYHMGLSLHP